MSDAQETTELLKMINRLRPWEKRLFVLSLAGWLLLLIGGLLIPTKPYREAIAAFRFDWSLFGDVIVVLAFYTVTNVLLLACLTALLGAAGGRARIEVEEEKERRADLVNPYTSAVLRSFFIYLVILSGVMISVQDPLQNFIEATPQQYVRLAALMSALGFMAGYNPGFFTKVYRATEKAVRAEAKESTDSAPTGSAQDDPNSGASAQTV